ncbi:hypothetical protein Tco_0517160 [Tanacetum coccineum]
MSLSLAENVIVVGADNHPTMLDKTNYSSWENQPGNETTPATIRARTYTDLTDEEKIYESIDIKDRVKLLIQGLELSLQERESKLYNDFDTFTSMPGETMHSYYMRFAQLINDMHTIGMTMKPLQVNTKFINHLQPEWSKFVTDVKLAKDMHTTNFNHLYAHLRQHEAHENEVRLSRQRYPDQIALVQPSFTELDSGLVISSFNPSDGLIANLNKLMAFEPSNHSRWKSHRADNSVKTNTEVKQEWLNVTTVKRKVILLDSALNQKGLRTQHNNGDTIILAQASQEIPTPAAFRIDDLDAFDSDCDDVPSAKAVLMANLSSYDSYVLLEVPFHDINIENNVSYQSVQKNQCSEQPSFDNDTEVDITSDNNIISYEQYLQETETPVVQSTSSYAQQDALLMCVIEEMSSQVAKCNKVQQENIVVNESLTAELERYKEQVIVDRNAKVADFEKQIHSLKLQLNATVETHKTLSTTVECLKKESNQKEDKYLDKVIDLQKKNKALDNVVYKIGNLKLAKESRIMKQDNAKQAAHNENLVPSADRVKIGKSNLRMDPFVNQREETYQVVLEITKTTPFYNAFLIFADKGRGRGAQGTKETDSLKVLVVPKRTISTSKKKQSKEKLVLHDESDESEGELEHRLTGKKKRIPRTKALKASRHESRFQHQIGSSSKGDGVRPEVLDELTRKSTNSNKGAGNSPKVLDESEDKSEPRDDLNDQGSNDEEQYLLAYKDEKPKEIPWKSTNEDESDNDDEEESDDDNDDEEEEQDKDPSAGLNQGKKTKKRKFNKSKSSKKTSTVTTMT